MKEEHCIYNDMNVLRNVYANLGPHVIKVIVDRMMEGAKSKVYFCQVQNLFSNRGTNLWSTSTGCLGSVILNSPNEDHSMCKS